MRRAGASAATYERLRHGRRYEFVAIFLDGKKFGEDEMLISLGTALEGQKVVLGFVQTATENEKVCAPFLRGLLDRGLRIQLRAFEPDRRWRVGTRGPKRR